MNKGWKIAVAVVSGVLVLCFIAGAVGAAVVLKNRPAAPAEPPPQASLPLLQAELITPNEGEHWPVNSFLAVRGVVKGYARVVAVELWIDGLFFGAREGLDLGRYTTATGEWYWQPATLGAHTLMLRGADETGQTVFSQRVTIQAVAGVPTRELVIPTPGQTLEQIAADQGVTLAALEQANPGIPPDQGLNEGDSVFLPDVISPVIDLEQPPSSPYEPPPAPPGQGGLPDWIGQLPLISNLLQPPGADTLPNAPTLLSAVLTAGCTVTLEFQDNSDNEAGFRLYRAMPGQADLAQINQLPPSSGKPLVLTDGGLTLEGGWLYALAAYNAAGEALSLPVTIDPDPACIPAAPPKGEGTGGDGVPGIFDSNFIILSPQPVSLAYVYITINGDTRRVPEHSNTFFQAGEVTEFDLTEYLLAHIAELPAATVYKIHVELWAWLGGKPELIEQYDKIISDFTRLLACLETAPGSCSDPGASWSTQIMIPETMEYQDVVLQFKVYTLKPANGLSWHMTSYYTGGELYEVDVQDNYGSPPTSGAVPATFSDAWADLYDESNQTYEKEPDPFEEGVYPWVKTGFWLGHHKYRAVLLNYTAWTRYRDPVTTNITYRENSNPVIVYNQLAQVPAEEKPQLAPVLPDLYTIEFLEDTYTLPVFADPARFGCVRYLDNGQEQCPAVWAGDPCEDSMSWDCFVATGKAALTQFMDYWDWFASRYNEVTTVVGNALIDFIPDCRGTDACEYLAQLVVDAAWSAITKELGLPEKLPTTEQLGEAAIKEVIRYYVGSAYQYVFEDSGIVAYLQKTGVDEKVQKLISNYLSEKAEEYQDKLTEDLYREFLDSLRGRPGPLCSADASEAHARGLEPFCPDPNRAWVPALGSEFVGPTVKVRVTRKTPEENSNYGTDATIANYLTADQYALKVTNRTINSYQVGTLIPLAGGGYTESFDPAVSCAHCLQRTDRPPVCYFGYGGQEGADCYYEVTAPMDGILYDQATMPIPWLDIGNSVEVPLIFDRITYFYPPKRSEVEFFNFIDPEGWKAAFGDDWEYLYYHGEQTFTGEVTCTSGDGGQVFCGASDTFSPPVAEP